MPDLLMPGHQRYGYNILIHYVQMKTETVLTLIMQQQECRTQQEWEYKSILIIFVTGLCLWERKEREPEERGCK